MQDQESAVTILSEEIAMSLHLGVARPLLDQGWPMSTVIGAIKRCTDLLPELEAEGDDA